MKSMKGTTLNRMLGSIKHRRSTPTSPIHDTHPIHNTHPNDDSPEAIAIHNVTLFCESGKPGQPGGSEEEVLYLPLVVEACESSPSAAEEAAHLLRRFLSKEYYNRPYWQYNSVMLIRILAENPGPTFTRNFDAKFVHCIKDLLRYGQDLNVRSLLVETLNKFLRDKAYYEGLELLTEMWVKERERMRQYAGPALFPTTNLPRANFAPQGYLPQPQSVHGLPSPQELSMRILEARTSANLLVEVTESTPISEINNNELVQELSNRCQNANLSIQMYISAKNPAPDNDVMENLIETNDMINNALSKHQRAILKARKIQDVKSTAESASRDSSSSRPGSTKENSGAPTRKEATGSSRIRENNSTPPGNENPFSDSHSTLQSERSHDAGSDGKYMMHAGGSRSKSDREMQNESSSKGPIYRY